MSSVDPLSKEKSESEGVTAALVKEKPIAEKFIEIEKALVAEYLALAKITQSLNEQDQQFTLEFSSVNDEAVKLIQNIVELKKSMQKMQDESLNEGLNTEKLS